jgi:hypothetical protein
MPFQVAAKFPFLQSLQVAWSGRGLLSSATWRGESSEPYPDDSSANVNRCIIPATSQSINRLHSCDGDGIASSSRAPDSLVDHSHKIFFNLSIDGIVATFKLAHIAMISVQADGLFTRV